MVDRVDLRKMLGRLGQEHLVRHWDELAGPSRADFERQLQQVDWDALEILLQDLQHATPPVDTSDLEPPHAVRLDGEPPAARAAAIQRGKSVLRSGKVGMILVAGGQGTRLGFPHPKGLFPIGPVSGRTLFQVLVDQLRAVQQEVGASIPLWILTSPATDAATREYFQQHGYLGLDAQQVHFFCQGTMPAVDAESAQVLLAAPGRLALSPNGHGGMLQALAASGGLELAEQLGVDYFFYGQVDNPLLPVCDARMIGYHVAQESEMTSLAVAKRSSDERVGNFVSQRGVMRIIEYSDFPPDVAAQTDANGNLRFWAGSIAVHVMSREFLARCAANADTLPYHRALKKVPFVDARGAAIEPETPNAIKFERFIFDLLPWAEHPLVVEVDRAEAFAPVKNAAGAADDTAATAQQAMLDRFRRWLTAAGATLTDDARVEIDPLWANSAEAVASRIPPGTCFHGACYLTDRASSSM